MRLPTATQSVLSPTRVYKCWADLEPDLIIPEALGSLYVSQNSKVDRDAAYLSLSLL